MTKQEFIDYLKTRGWKEDQWGHYKKEKHYIAGEQKTYRYKIGKLATRYEVKTSMGWVKILSGYYKNMRINEKGQIYGLSR
jgi:hypothetical protein